MTYVRTCRVDQLYVVKGLLLAQQVLVTTGVTHPVSLCWSAQTEAELSMSP